MEARSLKCWSCSVLAANIGAYPLCELLRLPLAQRYQLLDNLSSLEIWRLESDGFTEGLDTEAVWKERCAVTPITGIDFTHQKDQDPANFKIEFYTSITSRDAFFLSLWDKLDKMIKERKYVHIESLLSMLFGDKTTSDYSRRIPDTLRTAFGLMVSADQPTSNGIGVLNNEFILSPDSTKMVGSCMKDVLNLVLETGYRPSHIAYNAMMSYLEENEEYTLLERLLSKTIAISTHGEGLGKKWFEILLGNSNTTLKLGIKGGYLSSVCIPVLKAAERKRIEELVLYIKDEEICFKKLSDFLHALSHRNQIVLLDITAYQSNLSNYRYKLDHFKTFISFLHCLIKEPKFQCLRLCGLVTTTAAKSLILNFLSTPSLNPQTLQIDRMYNDSDGDGSAVRERELQRHPLPRTNTFYSFKTLIIDSIDSESAKTLRMHKYLKIKEDTVKPSHDCEYGSVSDWLLTLPNLKIGCLELKDYDRNCGKVNIPSTACIERMKIFLIFGHGRRRNLQWLSPMFITTWTNPSLQELTWHSRHNCNGGLGFHDYAEGLESALLNHVPGRSLKKLRITINYYFDDESISEVVAAAFPALQFSCYTDFWFVRGDSDVMRYWT